MNLSQQVCNLELSKKLKERVWKPIPGWENFYKVSNLGEILSLRRKRGLGSRNEDKIRTLAKKGGYITVALCKDHKMKYFNVHRLVALAFIPNPQNLPLVNHKDGDKHNNNVSNLEWCDHSYNIIHAQKNGLMGGEKHNKAKLTSLSVKAIRKLYPDVKAGVLADAFGVKISTIMHIVNFQTWKHI